MKSDTAGVANADGGSKSSLGGAVSAAGSGGKAAHGGANSGGAASAGTATSGGGATAAGGDGNPPEPPATAGADSGGAGGEPSAPPESVCGNGVIEAGEECDGGASKEKDGCSDDCQVVCAEHGPDLVESADHHCYGGYDQADFAGSREACTMKGAHLATIGSAAENEVVASLVKVSKYLGGFEDVPLMSEGTGEYGWITGEPLSYTSWKQGEPSRSGSRCAQTLPGGPSPIGTKLCYEHCVAMVADGKWDDQLCDRVDGYVCEWEPPGTK